MVSEIKENVEVKLRENTELKAHALFSSRAFLLSKHPYQESDLIVELLLDRGMRVAALARSARKSIKRFGGSLEALQLLEVQLSVPRSGFHYEKLLTLVSAETREAFATYRTDFKRLESGLFFNSLLRDIFPRGDLDSNTFQIAEEIFRLGSLESTGAYSDDWRRLYVWMWLSLHLGYGQLGERGLFREMVGEHFAAWMGALQRSLQHEVASEIVEIFADMPIEKALLRDLYSDWIGRSHLRCQSLEQWMGVGQ